MPEYVVDMVMPFMVEVPALDEKQAVRLAELANPDCYVVNVMRVPGEDEVEDEPSDVGRAGLVVGSDDG